MSLVAMMKYNKMSKYVTDENIILILLKYLLSIKVKNFHIYCEVFPFMYRWFSRIPRGMFNLEIQFILSLRNESYLDIKSKSCLDMKYENSFSYKDSQAYSAQQNRRCGEMEMNSYPSINFSSFLRVSKELVRIEQTNNEIDELSNDNNNYVTVKKTYVPLNLCSGDKIAQQRGTMSRLLSEDELPKSSEEFKLKEQGIVHSSNSREIVYRKINLGQQLLLQMLKEKELETELVGNNINVSAYRPAVNPQPYTVLREQKDGLIDSQRKCVLFQTEGSSAYTSKHDVYIEGISSGDPSQSKYYMKPSMNNLRENCIPLVEGAACVTERGKQLLEEVNNYVKEKYNAEVVYTDSDSSFIDMHFENKEHLPNNNNNCISIVKSDDQSEGEMKYNKISSTTLNPPQFKLIMSANVSPSELEQLRNSAISKRLKIIPFESTWTNNQSNKMEEVD